MSDPIAELYARYPALRQVETTVQHRLEDRSWIFRFVPRRAICAELGVFTGLFALEILTRANPSKLYMVDPWWKAFGENYDDWGAYTANGTLSTRAAYEAAAARAQSIAKGAKAQLVVDYATSWLETLPDSSLDWIYLDTGSDYDASLAELRLLAKKLKPAGIILGDDWCANPSKHHHMIFRAVHQFVRETDFCVVFAGQARQWMLQRMA